MPVIESVTLPPDDPIFRTGWIVTGLGFARPRGNPPGNAPGTEVSGAGGSSGHGLEADPCPGATDLHRDHADGAEPQAIPGLDPNER